jgi:hypothetical protein
MRINNETKNKFDKDEKERKREKMNLFSYYNEKISDGA